MFDTLRASYRHYMWLRRARKCSYCATDQEPCANVSPIGFKCTRPDGHSGDHVACDTVNHPIELDVARWENAAQAEVVH